MADAGSSNRIFEHGNPILLPPANHKAGRLIVTGDDQQSVWISHQRASPTDALRVNVAEGSFVGRALGWSVLAAGQYGVSFQPLNGDSQFLAFIQILPRPVFETNWASAAKDDASWLLSSHSADQRIRFREGAMHGVLQAEFTRRERLDENARWGLIARHYNSFHHMRVQCRMTSDACVIELLRFANTPPDLQSNVVVAQSSLPNQSLFPMNLQWSFNGTAHLVTVNGRQAMLAHDDHMGGVEIVGVIDDANAIACTQIAMDTTHAVQRHIVERPQYRAEIRPGNIDRLYLRQSRTPGQNLGWESGIQFGHIGGSEIKFTQCADLRLVDDGPVATSVSWNGPCPKFVDRADDIRGWADGVATFFHDHIVIADNVLTWTNRSVGPDIDLLGRLVDGPARLALAGEEYFHDWPLRAHGEMSVVQGPQGRATYPAALAMPIRLGTELWWLKVLILLRSPDPQNTPAGIFAWQCPHGLTASHDFRCTPTRPGQEYAFTIAVAWQRSESGDPVEHALLRWRNQWVHPMQILTADGKPLVRIAAGDGPREAMNLSGCFDRSRGVYVIAAGKIESLRLDPLQIARNQPVLEYRGAGVASGLQCRLDSTVLQPEKDFAWQKTASGHILLRLLTTLTNPAILAVKFEPEAMP